MSEFFPNAASSTANWLAQYVDSKYEWIWNRTFEKYKISIWSYSGVPLYQDNQVKNNDFVYILLQFYMTETWSWSQIMIYFVDHLHVFLDPRLCFLFIAKYVSFLATYIQNSVFLWLLMANIALKRERTVNKVEIKFDFPIHLFSLTK